MNPARKKPTQKASPGSTGGSRRLSRRGGGWEEGTVTAPSASQVSAGLGATRRLCSVKVRDASVLPRRR